MNFGYLIANIRKESPAHPVGRALASHKSAVAGAFTLLEILLVLALIAMLASVLVVGGRRVFADDQPSPEELFWNACDAARELAIVSDREVSVRSDAKGKKLVWTNGYEGGEAAFATTGRDVRLQFMPAQKSNNLITVAGQAVELNELPRVVFYPDGTCTAFRAQFHIGATVWQIAIDPWTCAPVLEKKEKGANS